MFLNIGIYRRPALPHVAHLITNGSEVHAAHRKRPRENDDEDADAQRYCSRPRSSPVTNPRPLASPLQLAQKLPNKGKARMTAEEVEAMHREDEAIKIATALSLAEEDHLAEVLSETGRRGDVFVDNPRYSFRERS